MTKHQTFVAQLFFVFLECEKSQLNLGQTHVRSSFAVGMDLVVSSKLEELFKIGWWNKILRLSQHGFGLSILLW